MLTNLNPWLIWLIAAAAILIIEIISFSVALICLCIGCVGACFASILGASISLQIVVAALVTIGIFFVCGRKIKKFYSSLEKSQLYTSNMDAIIGRKGRVTSTVTHDYTDGGRVQVDGDSWQAYTTSANCPINIGSIVTIEDYDSIVVKVKAVPEGSF